MNAFVALDTYITQLHALEPLHVSERGPDASPTDPEKARRLFARSQDRAGSNVSRSKELLREESRLVRGRGGEEKGGAMDEARV